MPMEGLWHGDGLVWRFVWRDGVADFCATLSDSPRDTTDRSDRSPTGRVGDVTGDRAAADDVEVDQTHCGRTDEAGHEAVRRMQVQVPRAVRHALWCTATRNR